MRKILAIISMSLISTLSFASNTTDLIERNVDAKFQRTAISLIEKASIKKVELINNRVVVNLDTGNKYFRVKVANGHDSFTKNKSLGTIRIPFPKKGDIVKCDDQECPSEEYLDTLRSYGITQTAKDTIDADYMEFYFMTIEYRSLFKADQDIHIGFRLTANGSSFDDTNDLGFFRNGCDQSSCWGSYGISLELKQK